MPGVLDADTHIAESEAMWSFIDKEVFPRRPVLARIPDDTWYHERNAFWLIDGEIFPQPAGKASFSLITPSAQKKESGRGDIHLAVHELTDPLARLKDMDKIGVQVQVIYPTLFQAAATWVPYIWHVLRRSVRPDFKTKNPQDLFCEYRFWIACEADEELPHLLNYIGADHLVIGSDYGHNDPSKKPDFVMNMRAREDVTPAVIEKILCDNARRLYGLAVG